MKRTPTVAKVVGANVRRIRQERTLRQDELAGQLRQHFGLRWTQATVAAVETGRRQVRLDELPMLCAAMAVTPAALFEGDGVVTLADGVTGHLPEVRKLVAGDLDVRLIGLGWKPPRITPEARAAFKRRMEVLSRLGPHVTAAEVIKWTYAEAETKAARKLGTDSETVTVAAFGLWKRSLTEHRDAIVAETAPADASPRTLQAMRGRVTRELVEELRARIEEAS